jgi:hypothetical protein
VIGTHAQSIVECASNESTQLILPGINQRKEYERLLVGSVTEDIIRAQHRDVLIILIDD